MKQTAVDEEELDALRKLEQRVRLLEHEPLIGMTSVVDVLRSLDKLRAPSTEWVEINSSATCEFCRGVGTGDRVQHDVLASYERAGYRGRALV